MKYIIKVSDEAIELMGGHINIFVEPEFKTGDCKYYALRLSEEDIEPYAKPDIRAIEDEVWELADKVYMMGTKERELCFGFTSPTEVMANLFYQEAKDKFEAWMKQSDEIHVGDEVLPMDTKYDTMIVTRIWKDCYQSDCIDTMGLDGSICSFLTSRVKKTGRHFTEVGQMLEKMRSGEE